MRNNNTRNKSNANKPSQGHKGPNKAKKQSSTSKQLQKRPETIRKFFNERYDFNIRAKSDDYVVGSLTGKYTNDIRFWNSTRITLARTAACLGTKIKTSDPLRSDAETIHEFEKTQIEPIFSPRIASVVKGVIDEIFRSFPYQEVLDELNDPLRVRVITNGAANPQLIAPINFEDGKSNAQLICAMRSGLEIFDYGFHIDQHIYGVADGKITTVGKNYKTNRMITITSRELTDKQLFVNNKLRDHVTLWSRNSHHIIQFDDQTVQHSFLKDGYATIDLSSASDRVYRSVIEAVWPDFMTYFNHLLPTTVSTDKGRIINLTCIGTQGFPLTFSVMAILCGAITTALKLTNEPSGNYGDDIALSEKDFAEVYNGLQSLGLVINTSKSHVSSKGFVESCGVDMRIRKGYSTVVTPIHLRGVQDVDVIQFFYQLCNNEIMDVPDAISMLDRLGVDYYAFKHEFQLTEFHFPFGEPHKVPKAVWDTKNGKGYLCKVPYIRSVPDSIKGLSKLESSVVLDLLRIEEGLKDPNINEHFRKGVDLVARPHRLNSLMDHRYYKLYQDMTRVEGNELVLYQKIMSDHNVTFKTLVYYHFITSEMHKYRLGSATVNFSECKIKDITFSDILDELFGIKPKTRFPIFRYTTDKDFKFIMHPSSNQRLEQLN